MTKREQKSKYTRTKTLLPHQTPVRTPKHFISDGGTQYKSKTLRDLLKNKSIKHTVTTPYNPEGNGTSERINQIVRRVLTRSQGISLQKNIQIINQSLQHSYHRCLGKSPYEVVNGINIFDPLNRKNKVNWGILFERSDNSKKISDENKNKLRRKIEFKTGQKVMLRNTNLNSKFDKKWIGPFDITELRNYTAIITDKTKSLHVNLRKIRHC